MKLICSFSREARPAGLWTPSQLSDLGAVRVSSDSGPRWDIL